MGEDIFRKKSLEKIKSPENLDDYIRVSNPGVWLLLVSIIILLAGACVWGVFGHIDSYAETDVRAENGIITCCVSQDDITSVKTGMTVTFGEYEAEITETGVKTEDDAYIFVLTCGSEVPDGIYSGKIVINSIRPLSLILN